MYRAVDQYIDIIVFWYIFQILLKNLKIQNIIHWIKRWVFCLFTRPCISTLIGDTAIGNSGGTCRESVLKQTRLLLGGLHVWLWERRTLLRYKLPGVFISRDLQRITASSHGSETVFSKILNSKTYLKNILKNAPLCWYRALNFGLFQIFNA